VKKLRRGSRRLPRDMHWITSAYAGKRPQRFWIVNEMASRLGLSPRKPCRGLSLTGAALAEI
jgi:hypothetical protein